MLSFTGIYNAFDILNDLYYSPYLSKKNQYAKLVCYIIHIGIKSHPNFSFKYFVLAEDKVHFSKVLTIPFLDFMENINGLEIEFRNNQCLFRLPKALEKEESFELCRIGLMLDNILNQ